MDHTLVVNCTSSCDRAAATATYARITISLGQHRTKTVRTAVVRTPVSTGRATGVHLTLPAAAMTALRDHKTVQARAITTATREGARRPCVRRSGG